MTSDHHSSALSRLLHITLS